MANKLGANESITDRHFLVLSKETKKTRANDDYFQLEISDCSGKYEAKIWGNNISYCTVEAGKIIEATGITQEYNGKISLTINRCQIVDNENPCDYSVNVPTMVFDIETIGKNFDELDAKEQDYLLNNLEKDTDPEEAKTKTALYSIFGKVCAIGCFDPNNKKGVVFSISDKELIPENKDYTYYVFKDEKSLLEAFWKMAIEYERFVTYNGENFDFPYLIIRSGINRVKVPFSIKKWSDNFIDLQQKIKQNRAYKLEMICKAFGVENPKEAGVSGSAVSELFDKMEYNTIADYVSRDAYSTSRLYQIWKEFMSGEA